MAPRVRRTFRCHPRARSHDRICRRRACCAASGSVCGPNMKITSINKPMKRGTAIEGEKNYEWFYEPRSRLCVREEEPRIPGCFKNIEPPHGARRKIVKAVRAAKAA